MHISNVQAYSTAGSAYCDYGGTCDVFIQVFVNDVEVVKSRTVEATNFNANLMYRSPKKISKDSTIRIEVWDLDASDNREIILRFQGDIQMYIDTPIITRSGCKFTDYRANYVETTTVWRYHFV